MADSKVIIELGVTGNAEVSIKKVSESIKDLSENGTKSLNKLSGAFDVFAGVLSAEAVLGAVKGLASAAAGLFETLITDGVRAASEQEDAINQLNQALVSSGQYSAKASEAIQKFASDLQAATGIADETILSTSALIENLTHLDKDGLQKATLAAVNLSAAMGIDLETAARKVSQAAEGNVDVLKKYNIEVQKGANDTETFARVLDAINKDFAGAAAAKVNTYSGAISLLNTQYGEVQEQIGNAIIKNQSLVSVIKVGAEILGEFSKYLETNKEQVNRWVSDGVLLGVESLQVFIDVIRLTAIGILKLEQGLVTARGSFSAFTDIVTLGMTDAGKRAQESADSVYQIGKSIEALESKESVFGKLDTAINRVREAAVNGYGQSTDAVNRFAEANKRAEEEARKFEEAQRKLAEEGKKIFEEIQSRDPSLEYKKKLDALTSYFESQQEVTVAQFDALIALEEEFANKKSALIAKEADELLAANSVTLDSDRFTQQERVRNNIAALQEILKNEDLNAKDRAKIQKNLTQLQSRQEQDRYDAASSSLNALSSLQTAKSKELAAVGKAAAIAQATIDTYRGATAAAAALSGIPFVGPALGIAAAAAFITAGLARVAQIAGVPLASGITEVPGGFNNDSFPARLSSGERVVDSGTNQDLKSFLGASNEMVPLLRAIASSVQNSRAQVTVVVGKKTIFDSVVEGLQDGRVLEV